MHNLATWCLHSTVIHTFINSAIAGAAESLNPLPNHSKEWRLFVTAVPITMHINVVMIDYMCQQ